MKLDLQIGVADKKSDVSGESRAFMLLESARLRCESLMAGFGRRDQLVAIHREIGFAGYITCAEFESAHRYECLALATARLTESPMPGTESLPTPATQLGPTLAKMFSETISASDALAGELATHEVDDARRDRLHLAHAHVMSACERLDERLTVLELEGAGIDVG